MEPEPVRPYSPEPDGGGDHTGKRLHGERASGEQLCRTAASIIRTAIRPVLSRTFCDRRGTMRLVRYQAAGGTGIGAVRPDGSVVTTPWPDFGALFAEPITHPDFRGGAFAAASTEAPAGGLVERAADKFRAWMRDFFTDLAEQAGARDPTSLGPQLLLLCDGAGVAARMDHRDPAIPQCARDAVGILLDAALPATDQNQRWSNVPALTAVRSVVHPRGHRRRSGRRRRSCTGVGQMADLASRSVFSPRRRDAARANPLREAPTADQEAR